MPPVAEADLRPVIADFILHTGSRKREIDVSSHIRHKNYHGFFPEAIIPQTKASGACNFEDDCIIMDELNGDEE